MGLQENPGHKKQVENLPSVFTRKTERKEKREGTKRSQLGPPEGIPPQGGKLMDRKKNDLFFRWG